MITHFRHRGLRLYHEHGDRRLLPQAYVARIERILERLDQAASPEAMRVAGWRLHRLHGNLRGFWAVRVSGNWRIIFRFEGRDAVDVDLIDYH